MANFGECRSLSWSAQRTRSSMWSDSRCDSTAPSHTATSISCPASATWFTTARQRWSPTPSRRWPRRRDRPPSASWLRSRAGLRWPPLQNSPEGRGRPPGAGGVFGAVTHRATPWAASCQPRSRNLSMSTAARELYRSPNGDRWCLVRDPGSGRVFVRHEPNTPSGGRASDFDVGEFLGRP
jgi:hypothetical protein